MFRFREDTVLVKVSRTRAEGRRGAAGLNVGK